jgi:hypothetical protein
MWLLGSGTDVTLGQDFADDPERAKSLWAGRRSLRQPDRSRRAIMGACSGPVTAAPARRLSTNGAGRTQEGAAMPDDTWRPLFRAPRATLTRVLHSPAFRHARERATAIVESPAGLRDLAAAAEKLDQTNLPLATVADRLTAAICFLRATADQIDASPAGAADTSPEPLTPNQPAPAASIAARARLVVAALDYLVTPDDLVPDFRAGGYVDDVLLLTWVFGTAVSELAPYIADEADTTLDPSVEADD